MAVVRRSGGVLASRWAGGAVLSAAFFSIACHGDVAGTPTGGSGASSAGAASGAGPDNAGASGNAAAVGGDAQDAGGAGLGSDAAGSASVSGGAGGSDDSQAGASGSVTAQAGALGAAGASGGGCSLGDVVSCDDHNSCTQDLLDATCVCSHQAMSNDAACDDQDPCTESDACSNGTCAGKASTRTPAVVGRLTSYGAGEGLKTLVAFPSDQRAVFASERRLTLIGLDGPAATILDDVAMSASVTSDSVGPMVWVNRPRTFLIPVLDHHLAVASANRGFDLYDLAGDQITLKETYGFGSAAWHVSGAVGLGTHMYTCADYALQAWSINPSTYEMSPGASVTLAAKHRCQGLALSTDGSTLYAATSAGLDLAAVNSDGSLTLSTGARAGNLVADVQASGDYVAVFEIRDPVSGAGDISVLSRSTLQPVMTFQADLAAHGVIPIGFSLLDGNRLLLQTMHRDDNDRTVHEALTLSIAATPTLLARSITLSTWESSLASPSYHTVSRGTLVALEPMHQLMRVDGSGALSQLPSPRQGSFERIRASSGDTLIAHGPGSAQHIDISDPTAPRVLAGGPSSPVTFERLRFDVTNPAEPSVLTISDAGSTASGPVASVLRETSQGLPELFGSIQNANSVGPWAAAHGSLYQLSVAGKASFRLQRFPAAAIAPTVRQTLTADLDQELATLVPTELDMRRSPLLAVDPDTGDVVVVEPRVNSSVSSVGVAVVSRFSLNGGTYERRYSVVTDPGAPLDVLTAGGRAVILISGAVLRIDATGAQQKLPSDFPASFERLLGLTPSELTIAASWGAPRKTEGALVLRADDFSEVSRYPSSDFLTSVARVGNHLVFGAQSALFVATPACSSR